MRRIEEYIFVETDGDRVILTASSGGPPLTPHALISMSLTGVSDATAEEIRVMLTCRLSRKILETMTEILSSVAAQGILSAPDPLAPTRPTQVRDPA
jgi:hypothetical protein